MEDAIGSYKVVRENLKGEGRAMASLAMAEILVKSDDHQGYREALRYYRTVADGNFIGAEEAYLRSALLQMKLGNDGFAIALIDKMERLFPMGELRHAASRLRGNITIQWLDKRAIMGDDHGLAKIFLTYKDYIPYGKKSGAYIQAGRAFIRLGFTTDAVKVLNSLVKMGKGKHLEEAMVLLAKGYLAQEDIESADRLAMFFKATFPDSKFKKEFVKLRGEIDFKKGEYDKIVSTRAVKRRADWNNSEEMMVVATSFFRLGKFADSEKRYRRAAELLAEREQNIELAGACMGVAESSFMQGKYAESIKFYRCASELSKAGDKEGTSIDRSWAIYRLAQSNFKIGKKIEATEALKNLKQIDAKMAEWGKYLFAENGK
jgi:tetratricopeptide (TPR) repeat protein